MSLSPERVLIFDTTLRDGDLAPGCRMTQAEKLRVARALAGLGVDVIEAGFPAASRADWESVQAVAQRIEGPVICALARCSREDIALAARALGGGERRRLHVFLATSERHGARPSSLGRADIVRRAVEGVRIAREFCDDVEFSAEDASRTELDFLAQVVEAAIEAGATTINIPDTVGHTVPHEFAELFRYLRKNVRGIGRATLSVHCHNDLGMAVANSLMAVVTGARQVECTLNGIGERAGNCSLEEVVMALKTRAAFFHARTGVDATRLYPAARLLASITGSVIPRNKAVIGESAFGSGADSLTADGSAPLATYAILNPQEVGRLSASPPLDRHSSREAFDARVHALGFDPDRGALERIFSQFTALAARKRQLFDGDIEALVLREESAVDGPWTLVQLRTASASGAPAHATVALHHSDGREVERSASGDGPCDAAFQAVEAATGVQATLRTFDLRSLSAGEDAQGEALAAVEYRGRVYRGASISTDIVEAATRAFLDVINRIELDSNAPEPWPDRVADDAGSAGVAAALQNDSMPHAAA